MLKGIDVSVYQKGLNLKGTGAQFAIMKATQGTAYVDPTCDEHYQLAKKQGLKRGVYHYANMGNPTSEANFFIENIRGYIHDAILVLDFETNTNVTWAKTWLDRVYKVTGVRPLVYMSASAINANWAPVVKANYGLWVAGYPDKRSSWNIPKFPYKIAPWPFYALWQYTDSNGTLDRDIFNGTAAAWDAYAGVKPVPKPTPKPTPTPKPAPAAPVQPTTPAPTKPTPTPPPASNNQTKTLPKSVVATNHPVGEPSWWTKLLNWLRKL